LAMAPAFLIAEWRVWGLRLLRSGSAWCPRLLRGWLLECRPHQGQPYQDRVCWKTGGLCSRTAMPA
jgi:hypothetical protein